MHETYWVIAEWSPVFIVVALVLTTIISKITKRGRSYFEKEEEEMAANWSRSSCFVDPTIRIKRK